MLLTNRHSVVRYVAAETRARNGQLGSSHQRTKQRRDAVDFQDVLNGRVYTIAVKQKNRPAKVKALIMDLWELILNCVICFGIYGILLKPNFRIIMTKFLITFRQMILYMFVCPGDHWNQRSFR